MPLSVLPVNFHGTRALQSIRYPAMLSSLPCTHNSRTCTSCWVRVGTIAPRFCRRRQGRSKSESTAAWMRTISFRQEGPPILSSVILSFSFTHTPRHRYSVPRTTASVELVAATVLSHNGVYARFAADRIDQTDHLHSQKLDDFRFPVAVVVVRAIRAAAVFRLRKGIHSSYRRTYAKWKNLYFMNRQPSHHRSDSSPAVLIIK